MLTLNFFLGEIWVLYIANNLLNVLSCYMLE